MEFILKKKFLKLKKMDAFVILQILSGHFIVSKLIKTSPNKKRQFTIDYRASSILFIKFTIFLLTVAA